MRLQAGHVRRLFFGFSCSIMFLVLFAMLIAHNSEAESAGYAGSSIDNHPLTIAIPTAIPESTITFYAKLGFRASDGLSGALDRVCMEKEGTPYKLEICDTRVTPASTLSGGVSGMSFRVANLADSVEKLKTKGLTFMETNGTRDGVTYASLKDPNGISIKLFEP